MITIEFLLTALVVVVVPGTGVIYTVSTALGRGTRAALIAAVGCTLGIIPHLSAAVFGLSAILHLSAQVFRVVRLVGAAYLIYLAWSTWRAAGRLTLNPNAAPERGIRIIGRAVLLNLLNPRLTIFFFAFLPQFVPAGTASPIVPMAVLSAVFMAMTLVVFATYGLLSAAARRVLLESQRAVLWVQRSFAAILAFFAVRLAIAEE